MTLTLALRTNPPARVLAAPLIPERMRGLNASAVAAMALRCGGETVAVGDLFEVSGAGSEEEALVLGGDLRGFDFIGAGMTSGELEVRGDVGAWAGAKMAGGVLRILGDAGARLGSAYPGARAGMTGGEIVVSGDAGEEVGACMRRGLVVVAGQTAAGAGLRMLAGTVIALVSDAGTPLISDPGYKLVRAVQEAGYPVTAIPGASSILAALAVAGLPTDQFFFVGFLPPKQGARRARIAELARVPATLVVFETGPRLTEALADLAAGLGEREAAVCRELTKLHEEVRRHLLKTLAQASANQETRGEFVLVIAPPPADAAPRAEDADALLRAALARTSLKEAVGEVMIATGLPRRTLYQRALALADETDKDGD